MRGTRRRGLFRIHAWIGLNLGFLLFVVCFSGTVAVFSAEMNWLADPALRVAAPAGSERRRLSWQAMHDRVAKAYPHALVLHLATPPGDRSAARAAISYGLGDLRWVLIDPYTGRVQGLRSGFNLVAFFRIFHKQLYIVPSVLGIHGTLIVGALAILLLTGTVTGLMSIKRWRRAFVALRRGRSRRLFWSDLHRLTGVWALTVTVVLSLTGIWYLAERVLNDSGALAEETRPSGLSADDLRRRPAVLPPLDLDRAAALARAAYPALAINAIALPARPGDPLVFTGQAEAWLVRDRANQVQMDPYTGTVLHIRRAVELGPFDRWIETADPLHFGTFAGLASRIVWFAAGLMLCAGILAGLYGAWLRLRQRPLEDDSAPRGRAAAAAAVPTLVLLSAAVYGVWVYGGQAVQSAQRPVRIAPLMQGELGPWTVSVVRLDEAAARSGPLDVAILFEGGGRPNFRRATLRTGKAETAAERRPLRHLVDRLVARLPCSDARTGGCMLHFAIEQWDGLRHTAVIDLRPHAPPAPPSNIPATAGMGLGETAALAVFALCTLLPLAGWIRLRFAGGRDMSVDS